ncbi:Nickel uptake substrate-specific transmembrane region [Aquisphaera giovannonii]|uniref:Nickel uptake substrate-specific transmembrane region n=1 Tax=Aquisphaera giovannonii TaxID=406548 RepID=A0A5B9W555_9BACT|nr:carboxypeptidase-like regulatory domain-containing protein [Aquisphaera giovannonii]QEH35295.1 Nickel uptake substrate-specific transmembrane region [Aquisphaera giovannonii]
MLLSFALWIAIPGFAIDDPPRMIDGIARYAGTDRPAAGLTLQIIEQADPRYSVLVDAQGRFRSPSPPGWAAPQPDGVAAPCSAVAEPEGRWLIEPINSAPFRLAPEQLRESVARGLSRHARAIWRDGVLVVECPEPGEVDVLVRGVDGKPLAARAVQVVPDAVTFQSVGPANARFTGRTDASGHLRMRWFEGSRQLRVTVPGEGTCSTPTFHVAPGKIVTVEALPMTRLGSISGRLAPKLAGPGIGVVLDPEVQQPTPCDAGGRFEIRDLPPGRYLLRLTKGNQGVRSGQVTVWLAPGGKVDGLVFDEIPPPTPEGIEQERKFLEQLNGRHGPDAKDELWVEGTVRDAAGRPLAGVDVFVRTAFHGGIRMYEDVRRTATDARGHYAISGPIHGFVEGLVVVAKAKGRPPAVANAEARSTRNDRPAKLDLTLAEVGGSASVAVIKDGKPLAGSTVRLEAEGGANIHFGFGWARAAGGAARTALDAVLAPAAETGRDGVAHFAELLPGLYTARSDGPAHGLAVSPGREAKATLSPAPGRLDVRFQVVRPDGRPVSGQDVSLQFGLGGQPNWSTSLKLDEDGAGSHWFESAGLWTIVVRFRDAPVNSFPIDEPPYYEAEAQVPLSPSLGASGPIRLVGARREPRSASLLVRLLDADGRPARGAVEFAGAIGSTDERGEIRFEGLPGPTSGGKQFASGHIEGPTPPPWSTAGQMPADDALRGRFTLVPGAEVTIVLGREETLELRARPLGYIRGKLRPAEGRSSRDYAITPWYDTRVLEPNWRYEPATGEFLAGPFPGGPATLQLSARMPDGSYQNCGRQVVEVVPGDVAHVELRPGELEAADRRAARQQVMLGMGGLAVNPGTPEAAPTTVLLPDGVTPAFAAQAILYVPDQEQPASHGISDASGRLTWRGMWSYGSQGDRPKIGLVDRPTLVVSLPGRHGATIVPLEEGPAPRVVLPPAIEAEGTVTIGGRPPSDDGSRIRVVAAYQGRGVLDSALGLATTAGPDGRFTFAGLTPGRYRVQAARDGIWISKTVEVVVEPGKVTPPLSLDIPPPGEPVTLEFVDRAGKPLAGESFTLARPEGPFAGLRPTTLRANASGRLTLLGLEAGAHSVSIAGTMEAQTFQVGEATGRAGQTTAKRVVLQRPGP